MITAAIVLAVIAVALGMYLAVDMLRGKKKAAALDTESAEVQPHSLETEKTDSQE